MNLPSERMKYTALSTVYPPISSQEASWLQRDPEVEALLRTSNFYMIGARKEAKFRNLVPNEDDWTLRFDLVIGDFEDGVTIRIRDLPGLEGVNLDSVYLDAGEKHVRFWDGEPHGPDSEVLEWFTTEKLVWDRSHARPGITGLDRFADAAAYDLLYVGIAKDGDTFDRLIAKGHKKRMEILSNEPQRLPGARVADEIYLFMFKINVLHIRFLGEDDLILASAPPVDERAVLADAEKAFIKMLDPSYNEVKYVGYPRGRDGVYGANIARYGYVIAENASFRTVNGNFRGGLNADTGTPSNMADMIFVEGNSVTVVRGRPA
ncbi:hypothetical protein [Micromonospora sp. WMMA1976]|uniref:hypothetical protein n=1 Tax=Micromonospora sp. WMMA1976 TaxID=3014995 RepID=UPI00248C10BD|nr:hypothetical protein [Micromonospora sp. WMMA1976]WBC04238.1 hypothetical protein O7546_04485 [Micromonospora sp. WMMA1976]